MKHTLSKLGAAVSTVALLSSSFVGVVSASVTGTGLNNTTGADSENNVSVDLDQSTYVDQTNNGVVVNNIDLNSNTGDNTASKNTGEGSVKTGDVNTGVGISNSLNSNAADIDACGGCNFDLYVGNEKTGADSDNQANIKVKKDTVLEQHNSAFIVNDVKHDLNTGGNKANKNTGMGDISTGDADSVTLVDTSANDNVAHVGSGNGGTVLTAGNDTTGADSENNAEVNLDLSNWMNQSNNGNVLNSVNVKANTGDNDANKNTGMGDVATGDIDTGVGVSSNLNSNFLAFDGCCDVELGMLNTKTGADSNNQAEAKLKTEKVVFQSNCERGDHRPTFLGLFGFGHDQHDLRCGVVNTVKGDLDTGNNSTNKNTADGIDSGDVGATVQVSTDENQNVIGSAAPFDLPDVAWGDVPSSAWWMLFFGYSS